MSFYIQKSAKKDKKECKTERKARYTEDERKTGEWVRDLSERSYRGWKAFYHTPTWSKTRTAILKRDHYECQRCKRLGKYTKATTVHHKEHLKDCPELALTWENLESLCEACHNAEHPEKQYKGSLPGFRNVERW